MLCILYSRLRRSALPVIFFMLSFACYGQTVETWAHTRVGAANDRVNLLINGLDSVHIGDHLSSTGASNRKIITKEDEYRFEFVKNTQQEILYNSANEKLATCSGRNISFFTCVNENGDRYTMKKSGNKSWDYFINDQLAIKGHLLDGTQFQIHTIQDNMSGIELAKIMSYAYTSEVVHNKQNAPIYIGLIVAGVLLRVAMAAASGPQTP